jgi:cell division septum initiation protein DivIVA
MAVRNLTDRVEVLEMKVGSLEELPARISAVESQIVQLRIEMRGEFSAVRQEMRALNEETTAEMRTLNAETKAQLLTLHEEVLDRISRMGEGRPAGRKRTR